MKHFERIWLMHRSVFKHLVFLLGILIFNTCLLEAQSCVCGTRKPCAAERVAASQLYMARQSRDAGDMATAELLWRDAGKSVQQKNFIRPAWLDEKPLTVAEPIMPSMEERLARIASLPYELAGMLLSDILERDPANARARQLYLSMADVNSDQQQVLRHQSIFDSCRATGWKNCLWYAASLLLSALVIVRVTVYSRRLSKKRISK